MPGVVVLGSLNVDFVFRALRLPVPGETLLGEDLAQFRGGKGGNQAVACARMGAPTAMIGAVGDDANGAWLLQGLIDEGIDTSQVAKSDRATGAAGIFVGANGSNQIVVSPGANGAVDEFAFPRDCSVALTQHEVPSNAVDRFLREAHRAETRFRILNPAPARPLTPAEIEFANVIVPNETEAALIAGASSDPASSLVALGFEHVLITLGEEGVLYASSAGQRRFSAPKVNAIDSTAAGDVFCGSMAAFLSEGVEMEAAIEWAIQAAALSVTRAGAQGSAPFRRELGG